MNMLHWILKVPIRNNLQAWLKVWRHFTKQLWSEVFKLINVYRKVVQAFYHIVNNHLPKGAADHITPQSSVSSQNLIPSQDDESHISSQYHCTFWINQVNYPAKQLKLELFYHGKLSVMLIIFNVPMHAESSLTHKKNLTL